MGAESLRVVPHADDPRMQVRDLLGLHLDEAAGDLVEVGVAAIRRQGDDGDALSERRGEALRRLLAAEIRLAVAAWSKCRGLTHWERTELRVIGAEQGRIGVRLPSLENALRAGGDALWDLAMRVSLRLSMDMSGSGVSAQLVADLATELRDAVRAVCDEICSGLVDSADGRWRRAELLHDVFSGAVDAVAAHERARFLGYDLDRPHALLLLCSAARLRSGVTLRRTLSRLLSRIPGASAAGEGVGPVHAVVAVPVQFDEEWLQALRAADEVAREAGMLVVGASPVIGVTLMARAYTQARADVCLSIAAGRPAGLVVGLDLFVERALLALPAVEQAELLRVLAGLAGQEDRDHLIQLVTVLDDVEGSMADAGRVLNTHKSTVGRLVRRIETLTRLSFAHPEQRRRLYAAARLQRLRQHPLLAEA